MGGQVLVFKHRDPTRKEALTRLKSSTKASHEKDREALHFLHSLAASVKVLNNLNIRKLSLPQEITIIPIKKKLSLRVLNLSPSIA